MTTERQPATPVESAVAFDLVRVALANVLLRRARRGSATGLRITKRERDRLADQLEGQRVVVRVVVDAEETIHAWLELVADEGQRPGVVYSNLPIAPEPKP